MMSKMASDAASIDATDRCSAGLPASNFSVALAAPPIGVPCRMCKRGRETLNRTPSHRTGRFLHFPKDECVCSSCLAVWKKQCKGEKRAEYTKMLDDKPDAQKTWTSTVEKWEDAFDAST